jgi:hypothetical protein
MEDSIRWLSSKNFNQKFVKSFAKWSGSTLIAASDENLHNVCKDRAEVARLITLLEVEVRKSEEVSQQSPSTVIDISGDEPAEKSTYSTKGGEYCFATLDDNLMSHPSKQEGRRKVVEAGVLITICGLENFKKFKKIGEIGFTASAILDRIKLDNLKGQLHNWVELALSTDEQADRFNQFYYYGKVHDLPLFNNLKLLGALLTSQCTLMECAAPDALSILIVFQRCPQH